MKVKERESWVVNNVGRGGKKTSYDPYNKALKGNERNPKVKEYATQGLEGYHHYAERAEYKEDSNDSDAKKKQEKKRSSNTSNIRNIITRVIGAAVGAVVVVATYTSMTTVESSNWVWDSDMTSVKVELLSDGGTIIKELPAEITVTTKDSTCAEEGLKTFIATASDDESVYTDTRYEVLPKAAHDYHILESKIEDGKIIVYLECTNCHEKSTVEVNIEDND